jgi:hypothetical protein
VVFDDGQDRVRGLAGQGEQEDARAMMSVRPLFRPSISGKPRPIEDAMKSATTMKTRPWCSTWWRPAAAWSVSGRQEGPAPSTPARRR